MQAGVAVVERNAPVESLIDVDFGSSKTEALALLRNLEAVAVPLHDVVVTDDALMNEAADAVEIFWSRAPCSLGFARMGGEAAIVVGDEKAQDGVGGIQMAGLSQAELAGEAVLQHAPEALDAAFGLRTACGDEGDAELFQSTTELGGLTFSGELFLEMSSRSICPVTIRSLICYSKQNCLH